MKGIDSTLESLKRRYRRRNWIAAAVFLFLGGLCFCINVKARGSIGGLQQQQAALREEILDLRKQILLRKFLKGGRGETPTEATETQSLQIRLSTLVASDSALEHQRHRVMIYCLDPTDIAWLLLCIALLSIWVISHRQIRAAKRRGFAGLCIRCGYDLRGIATRCPECGTAFERLPHRD
jgi:hypothetical protein